MKSLSWNCWGMGNPRSVRELRSIYWRECPNIVFVMETMVNEVVADKVKRQCCFVNGINVSSVGRSGGLAFWWKDVDVNIVSYSNHHFLASVKEQDLDSTWHAAGIYGWASNNQKHLTWELMHNIRNSVNGPLIFFGDFNEILFEEEKCGGASRSERKMEAFREVVVNCQLKDLGFTGDSFTWQRGNNPETSIRECLDRALVDLHWMNIFPCASIIHLPRYTSDHSPIVIKMTTMNQKRNTKRKFVLEKMWTTRNECNLIMKEAWDSGEGESLLYKSALCCNKLKSWSDKEFGRAKKEARDLEKELAHIQKQHPSLDNIERGKQIVMRLDTLHKDEELKWYMRAKTNELKDGDRNTSYFHYKASSRRRRNLIKGVEDENGNWTEDETNVERIITDFYKELFTTSSQTSFDEALIGVEKRVTDEMNQSLIRLIHADE